MADEGDIRVSACRKERREFGRVEIPQEVFIAALKMDEN
jgi:translation elongation factor EF-4